MLWCPVCKVEASLGKKFCKSCGGRLEEKTPQIISMRAQGTVCPKCKATVSPGLNFCESCGATVVEEPEPSPPPRAVAVGHTLGAAAAPKRAPAAPIPARQADIVSIEALTETHKRVQWPRWSLPVVGIVIAVIGLGIAGWYFRASLPLASRFAPVGEPIGLATIAQADTPAFAEPTRSSQVEALLPIEQRVGLLTIPDRAGADGIFWSRIRFGDKKDGFVDVRQLKNLTGNTDAAQYKILGLVLHPLDSEINVLQTDLQRLKDDFIVRFSSSPLTAKVKMAMADRYLSLARREDSYQVTTEVKYQDLFGWASMAADLYKQCLQSDADRQAASHGQEESLKLVSFYDAKLNPPPAAELNASSDSIYRGQPVTLSWASENAVKVTIEPDLGTVELRGARVLYPTQSTRYRMVAVGTRQQTESAVQVNVMIPSPGLTFNLNPNVVQRGQPITLSWSANNANEVNITPNPGRVSTSGTVQLYPTSSTTYQLVASGDGGTAQQQAVVTVVEGPPPVVAIAVGTQISVRLADTLDTGQSQQGQTFRATLDQPIFAGTRQVIPKHADILGRVVYARASGRASGVAQLSIILYQVTVGGVQYPLSTDPISFQAQTQHGKDAATVAGGAILGAILGGLAGGGKGAGIGAAAGAGAGTGAVLLTKGKEIHLAQETVLTFRTNQTLTLRQ